MRLNENHRIYQIKSSEELNNLKSLFVKEVNSIIDDSFEAIYVQRMYRYKFMRELKLASLRFRLNPYLVFFDNRISNEQMTLNKGFCVMYPSILVTGNLESHVKFLGTSGVLLYELSKRYPKTYYNYLDVISAFSEICGVDTRITIHKIKRIFELLITDLFLIIE